MLEGWDIIHLKIWIHRVQKHFYILSGSRDIKKIKIEWQILDLLDIEQSIAFKLYVFLFIF